MAKRKKEEVAVKENPKLSLKPINIDVLGSDQDPCFGKEYNLSTKECKMCGDSDLCAIKLAQNLRTTREEVEKETKFKDLDRLYDLKAIKKTIRSLKKKEYTKREIVNKVIKKYQVTKEEAKEIYNNTKII